MECLARPAYHQTIIGLWWKFKPLNTFQTIPYVGMDMPEGTKPEERAYVVVTLNPSTDYYWEIHALGCRDLDRRYGAHGAKSDVHNVSASSVEDVIHQFLDPETAEMGYGPESFRILPCTRNAPKACPL